MNKVLFCLLLVLSVSAVQAEYKIDHRISLSGAEGWDYLAIEPTTNRLYVSRGNHVDVVDLKTEKIVGQISDPIDGAHGFAFVPLLKKGYVTSGKSAKVVVFDLQTLKVLKEIPAGKKTDAIVFEPKTQRVFAFNGGDANATVIDVKTDLALKQVPLGGRPEFAVASAGLVYVNNEEKNQIQVIDAQSMSVIKTWALASCQEPTGIAADFQTRRLFPVCGSQQMEIIDADTGKSIQVLPIGAGADAAAFDAGLIFSSNGAGDLTIVQQQSPTKYVVMQNLSTQKGARTLAVDSKTHQIYLAAAQYEPVDPNNPKARPKIVPGSVQLIVLKKQP